MEPLIIVGYASATLIGLVLGLTGSGGAILTVPVLVYLLQIDPVLSTAYSLIIVGIVALIGMISSIKQETVDYKVGLLFAVPSIIGVFLTRRYLMPSIPDHILTIGAFELTKALAIMLLFAALMLWASIAMIRSNRKDKLRKEWRLLKKLRRKQDLEPPARKKLLKFNYPLILLDGLVIGILAGLLGAGGGFLIIPALVLMLGLSMKTAVGTSLMIITINSIIGTFGEFRAIITSGAKIWEVMDPILILTFCLLGALGILLGNKLSKRISAQKLKLGFGYFVMGMAILIIVKELVV